MAHSGVARVKYIRLGLLALFLGFGLCTTQSSRAGTVSSDPAVQEKKNFSAHTQPVLNFSSSSLNSATALSNQPTYPDFPHIGLYGGFNSSGWPLVGYPGSTSAGPNDPLNSVYMDEDARFQYLILPAMPAADLRPDILTGLRQRNPNIHLYAYVIASTTWCPTDTQGNIAYPANTYYHDYYLTVTGGDPSCASTSNRFLWMQDGLKADQSPHTFGINVNLAHRVQNPDSSYTYDVAESIASTMYAYAKAAKNWDGMFIDTYCQSIIWEESPGNLIDYARAGYGNDNTNAANRTAFDQGWQAGALRLSAKLRELATADGHPEYPIMGNCGTASADNWSVMNGWMRENFPFQQGGTFYSNMFGWPYGYLHQNYGFRSPQFNFVNTQPQQTGLGSFPADPTSNYNPYSTANQHYMRFGLASASLGNGLAFFDTNDLSPGNGNWPNWWFDEYGVNTFVPQSDPNYGHSAIGQQYSGWLGQPTTTAYSMLSSNYATAPDLLTTNQGFETAGNSPSQLPGWITPVFGSTVASYERTTSTAASGAASVHAMVTAIDNPAYFWSTYMASGNFQINASTTYSISFKAKTSSVLPVTIALGNVTQTIPIDSEWRQYQVILTPTNSVANGTVGINLGLATGEYWFDDVTVKVGSFSLWRRDFDKGSVFVNPSDSTITVQLGAPMKKITGVVNPTVNDGSVINNLTLNGTNTGTGIGDAVFLLSIDTTPPAAVNDLSANP